MKLFEITNQWTGESYVRVYAWCETEDQALEMATSKFKDAAGRRGESYYDRLMVQELFDSESEPFVTEVSDCDLEMSADE